MLIGKQIVMGLETFKKRATQNTHVNVETNKQKLGFLGNGIMHARTGLRMHEFSLRAQARPCVCRSLARKSNLHRNKVEAKQNIRRGNQQPIMLKRHK